jgi:hypothetical protein
MDNDERNLSGSGIHGQTVVVAPEAGIVIALYSGPVPTATAPSNTGVE